MSFCPICFDEIQGATNIVVTDCGHSFHCNCLMMNASRNGFSCPCCRSNMNQNLTIVVPTENPVFEPTSPTSPPPTSPPENPPENEENEENEEEENDLVDELETMFELERVLRVNITRRHYKHISAIKLKGLCRIYKIKGFSKLKKNQLMDLLLETIGIDNIILQLLIQ
jgi:hypothetical protein